jgi:hypothetical protein
MLTSFVFIDKSIKHQKLTLPKKFKYSPKDLEILDFILKMKFANVEDIHNRFFKLNKFGEPSSGFRWAQYRLTLLTHQKFLKRVSNIGPRYFYIVTMEGYYFLKRANVQANLCKPIDEIDIRTFEHDHQLIQIRNQLENTQEATHWISDRELSEATEFKSSLPFDCRPDAIFKTLNGERVALELEKARKSKDRYQQKIRSYIKLMTEEETHARPFDRAYFICESKSVLELIRYQTELYQYLFKFELLKNIISIKES